ncbi:MAG: hypothetical protein ACYC3S_11500 [Chloroflexota bacterium]
MRVLHIVRQFSDRRAIASAVAQSEAHEVTLLLLQDAVRARLDLGLQIVACREDVVRHEGQTPYPALDYAGIMALIFASDRVITW